MRYHRQQNKCNLQKCQIVKKLHGALCVMKFDRSNKFDLCYYGQVNLLQLKSSVASKLVSIITFGGNINFPRNCTSRDYSILADSSCM